MFPSTSTVNLAVFTETYPYRSLGATITPVGLNRSNLNAELTVVSTNFYPGGHYVVKIKCKDLAGNEMPEFTFEFTIRGDGL